MSRVLCRAITILAANLVRFSALRMTKNICRLIVLASVSAGILFAANWVRAQENSYRLTPPLRLAARPATQTASTSSDRTDPFRHRDPRSKPTTIAAQGYCLVTLRDQRKWVLGSRDVQAIRGDKIYLFANARERDIFAAAPELYLPALDGDCLVTFADTGERQPGQLQWGMIHQGRVYFFARQEHLLRFQTEPQAYVDADLVDHGRCIVSKIEENRTVPGLPKTVAVINGRRYFFASAFHRKLFEGRPQYYIGGDSPSGDASINVEIPSAEIAKPDLKLFGESGSQMADGQSPAGLAPKSSKKGKKGKKASDRDDSGEQIENRAMAGYCPVTIRTQGLWQRGKAKFKSTFDGKSYFLLGPEELAVFQENKKDFMPVLGGDSVVSLVNDYERVSGSVFNAVQYKDRLYLFTDPQQKKAFGEQPALFENADLYNGGNCVVSQLDDKKEVQGSLEYETVYRGLRYRFASEGHLKEFLSDPKVFVED
jgi:YHS domain-containing protein